MPIRIVTTTYRYKPPPRRKGRKLAKITGPAVVTAKKGRHLGKAAAEVGGKSRPSSREVRGQADTESTTARAGGGAHIRANDDRKSAIVTVPARKTVQRQREQQQMARIVTYIPSASRTRGIAICA